MNMNELEIDSNSSTKEFKPNIFRLKELQMKLLDDLLIIKLKASQLINNQFLVRIEEGTLVLSIIKSSMHIKNSKLIQKPIFQNFFLSLPNKKYEHIIKLEKTNNTLEVYLSKSYVQNVMMPISFSGVA